MIGGFDELRGEMEGLCTDVFRRQNEYRKSSRLEKKCCRLFLTRSS